MSTTTTAPKTPAATAPLFIKSNVTSTGMFSVILLPDQDRTVGTEFNSESEFTRVMAPFDVISKYPMQSVFISDSWELVTDTLLKMHAIRPLIYDQGPEYGMTAFIAAGRMDPDHIVTREHVEAYVRYVAREDDENYTKAKAIADVYKPYGIEIDVDVLLAAEKAVIAKKSAGKRLLAGLRKKYPRPTVENTGFDIDNDLWELLVRNVERNKNTLIIGPTGTGKTEILKHLSATMGLALNIQDMGTVQDAQSALLGVHRLEDSKSVFDFAPFTEYIQNPGIVLADELNRSPREANNLLFPLLDDRRYMPVDIAHSGGLRRIDAHPECRFFATANLGAEYSGTNAIDRALFDRFMPVEVSYPTEDRETRVLMLRTDVEEREARTIVNVATNLRRMYREQEISSAISVRHTLMIAELVSDGFKLTTAMTQVIMPLFEDGETGSERALVKTAMAAH